MIEGIILKKIVVVIILIFSLFPTHASAHPGSLDANGGHWDRKNGVYHYHDGTNQDNNPGGPSKYTPVPSDVPKPTRTPKPTPTPTPAKSSSKSNLTFYVAIALLGIPLASFMLISLVSMTLDLAKKNSPQKHLDNYEAQINRFVSFREKRHLLAQTLLDTSYILPSECFLGSDGLPRQRRSEYGWGPIFTYYKAESPRGRLHRRRSCSSAYNPVHIYTLIPHFPLEMTFCQKCRCPAPLYDWLKTACEYRSSFLTKEKQLEEMTSAYANCNSTLQNALSVFSLKSRRRRHLLNDKYQALIEQTDVDLFHLQVLRAFNRFFLDFETSKPAKEKFVYTKKVKILYSSEPSDVSQKKEYTLEGLVEYVRHEGEPPPEGCYLLRINFPSGGYLHFEGCKNKIYPNKPVKIFDVHNDVHYIKLLAKRNFYDF